MHINGPVHNMLKYALLLFALCRLISPPVLYICVVIQFVRREPAMPVK